MLNVLFATVFVFVQLGALTVSAMTGCAAEANFQACKSIEISLLNGCGPVDYACQCNAQNLIKQCYNLCPEYSIDANEQARIATGICAAVPTTSAARLPSGSNAVVSQTWWPSSTVSAGMPSASQSVTTSASVAMRPSFAAVGVMLLLAVIFQ